MNATRPSILFLFLTLAGVSAETPQPKPEAEPGASSAAVAEKGETGKNGGIRFYDSVGTHSIPDSGESVIISGVENKIQFRIRGAGPSEPLIRRDGGWFIASVTKDQFWVHLGEGRLFYYSWRSDKSSRVDEWKYPNLGSVALPPEIEAKLKRQLGPQRDSSTR